MDTAMNLIAKGGIQECTIRNIAGAIGLSEPAIYRHFNSKQDILLGILSGFSDLIGTMISDIRSADSGALKKIETFLERVSVTFTGKPIIAAIVFSEEIFQNDGRLAEEVYTLMTKTRDGINKILSDGQRNGEIRNDISHDQLSLMLMGSLRLLVTQWRLSGYSFKLTIETRKLNKTIAIIFSSKSGSIQAHT
ncbi:MAG: TetR/AcrR family transcriptional regulator [Spirochaetes bacterium]|nr:TetR/AcrR family transcriptional regulator [Spirochaetota bacterium]